MPNNKKKEVSYLEYLRSNPDKVKSLAVDVPEGMEAGDSKYDENFIVPQENEQQALEHFRGAKQGAGAETLNTIAGGVVKIPFTVVGNVASVLDFEDYNNQDQEVGNAITKWTEDVKKSIGENTPIYQSNSDNTLSSREWWMQNGQELINSAGAFAVTGAGIGSGLKVLNGLKSLGLSADVIKGVGATVNATALNQAESIPIAMNVFDKAYQLEFKKQQGLGASQEEADKKAKETAADAATYSVQINRLNIPLNLTSAGAFVRTPQMTRQIAKEVSKGQVRNKVLSEGIQEYVEEDINMIAENEAMRKAQEGNKYVYDFNKTVDDVLSKEGLESGIVGFLGGVLQTGATAVTEDYIKKNSPSFDEEGNVLFDEQGSPVGVSRIQSQKERFAAQQNNLKKIEAVTATENLPTLKKVLEKTQNTARIVNDIQEASLQNDDFKVEALQNELLSNQALDAFKTGSTQSLVDLYKSIGSEPNAEQKYGPEYKKRSNEAVKQIETLENIYNKLPQNKFTADLFTNRASHNYLLKASEQLNIQKSEALREQQREILATGYNSEELIKTLATTQDLLKVEDKIKQVQESVINLNTQFNDILTGKFVKPENTQKNTEVESPTASVEQDITDEQYIDFLDNKKVSPEVLNTIADKIVNNRPRTARETEIANASLPELEVILQEKIDDQASKPVEQTPQTPASEAQSNQDFGSFLTEDETPVTPVEDNLQVEPTKDTPEQASKVEEETFTPEILTTNVQPSELKPLRGGAYVSMMKLYLHERKNLLKNKIFNWLRDPKTGLAIIENNSKIDADFVNSPTGLKVGDVVEYRVTELEGEAQKNNLEAIADITDVDRKYLQPIGMYVDDKLVGFYRLPNESATEEDNEFRKTVIEERKKIIDRIDEGAIVSTTVKEKGTGNLLTKSKDAKEWLTPINNSLLSRPQDKVAGNDVFAYVSGNGNLIVPPIEGATQEEISEVDTAIKKIGKRGKSGYIYKLVRSSNNQWMPIPIYRAKQESLNLFDLNTKAEQERLYADNSLLTNAYTDGGNFYVQPYVEVYPVDEAPDSVQETEVKEEVSNDEISKEGEEGTVLYQSENQSGQTVNEKLNTRLKEFLFNNGIKLEFVDTLLDRLGNNVIAAYDTVNQVIKVANGKADATTLPEEVGHAAIRALGKDHPLVKTLLENVSKLDYKTILGPRYVELYKNNDALLIEELAGKYLGDAIIKNEPTPIRKSLLENIWNRFKQFFKGLTQSELDKVKEKITGVSEKLAGKVLLGENLGVRSQVKPDNQFFYQVEPIKEPKRKFTGQIVKIRQFINRKIKDRDKFDPSSPEYGVLDLEIQDLRDNVNKLEASESEQILINTGSKLLDMVEEFLNKLDKKEIKLDQTTAKDAIYAQDIITNFKVKGLGGRAAKLQDRFNNYKKALVELTVSRLSNDDYKWEDIMAQTKDINPLRAGLNTLSSTPDILAGAIGREIKASQNNASERTKKFAAIFKQQLTSLRGYAKKTGTTAEKLYKEVFTQEFGGTLTLTKPLTTQFYLDFNKAESDWKSGDPVRMEESKKWGKDHIASIGSDGSVNLKDSNSTYHNKNFKKIQSTPELKQFYDFHQKTILEIRDMLPINLAEDFIANFHKKGIDDFLRSNKSIWKSGVGMLKKYFAVEEIKDSDIIISADVDDNFLNGKRFTRPLSAEEKSTDLAENLFKFYEYAVNYQEMTDLLPKTILLEDTINSKGELVSFTGEEHVTVKDSNLMYQVKAFKEIQIRGNKIKPFFGKVKIGNIRDAVSGKVIGKKVINLDGVFNSLLGSNSLLRIAFAPASAFSNATVGHMVNAMEGFGGQFYSNADLRAGTLMFATQINDENSPQHKFLDLINPLMKLSDYETINRLDEGLSFIDKTVKAVKTMDYQSFKAAGYVMQKKTELFVQAELMNAMLIHDGYIKDGKITPKGESLFNDPIAVEKIRNRVQTLSSKIQGRYSDSDQAAATTNILIKSIFQFRKFIPAVVEARFQKKYYDENLASNVEGRFLTFVKFLAGKEVKGFETKKVADNILDHFMMIGKILFDQKAILESGKLDAMQLSNIRKTLLEVGLIIAGTMLVSALDSDDDDLRKNPWYKLGMNQLSRLLGDLTFFIDPSEPMGLVKNIAPVTRIVDDYIKLIKSITTDPLFKKNYKWYYTSGEKAHEFKPLANLVTITPFVNQVFAISRKWKDIPYIDYTMAK